MTVKPALRQIHAPERMRPVNGSIQPQPSSADARKAAATTTNARFAGSAGAMKELIDMTTTKTAAQAAEYVLVPREPSEDMLLAAAAAMERAFFTMIPKNAPYVAYNAMLAAAPVRATGGELREDEFRGDNAKLVGCINALLDIDAAGALVPHGLGGHARTMLTSAAIRLAALSAPAIAPGGDGGNQLDEVLAAMRSASPQCSVFADRVVAACAIEIDAIIASRPHVRTEVIEDALFDYRCQHWSDDDGGSGLLIDVLTPNGDDTVERGQQEIRLLAEHVAAALPAAGHAALAPATADVLRELAEEFWRRADRVGTKDDYHSGRCHAYEACAEEVNALLLSRTAAQEDGACCPEGMCFAAHESRCKKAPPDLPAASQPVMTDGSWKKLPDAVVVAAIEARNAYLRAHPGEALPAMRAAILAAQEAARGT